jgi:hypothetical protein
MQALQENSNGRSLADIFARLWEIGPGKMPPTLARYVLRAGFAQPEKARMHELAVKNQDGVISPGELEELQNYVTAGDLLALLQSRARKALKVAKRPPVHHG